MQNTAIVAAKDSSLQKKLLSEAHVSVREGEREPLALGFVMELRSIAGSDKRHSSTPLRCICDPPRGFLDLPPRRGEILCNAATVQRAGRAQNRHLSTRGVSRPR